MAAVRRGSRVRGLAHGPRRRARAGRGMDRATGFGNQRPAARLPVRALRLMAVAIERRAGGVLRVEMDRPQALNAFDEPMAGEITQAFDEAGRDDSVRCVV